MTGEHGNCCCHGEQARHGEHDHDEHGKDEHGKKFRAPLATESAACCGGTVATETSPPSKEARTPRRPSELGMNTHPGVTPGPDMSNIPKQHVQPPPPAGRQQGRGGHGGHGLMMIACCVPMLAIAIGLVATGVVGIGFVFIAVACTAMMALMMRGMNHGGTADADHQAMGSGRMDHSRADHSASRPLDRSSPIAPGRPVDR